jgi:hypothetical protein
MTSKKTNILSFQNFLEKYYLSEELNEIEQLLNQLGISNGVELVINDFYTNHSNTIHELNIAQLSITITNFITLVNTRLSTVEENKDKIIEQLATLGIYLIKETYSKSKLSQEVYFNTLKFSLRKAYSKHNWNFQVLESILNFEEILSFTAPNQVSKKDSNIKLQKAIYLDWNNNKISCGLFLKDISKAFEIQSSQDNLLALFDSLITKFTITIHSKYLEAYVMLFYTLYQKKIITAKGNKGYLAYLQQHTVAPKNDTYPRKEFKRIREECSKNIAKKKSIETFIQSLLQKYL